MGRGFFRIQVRFVQFFFNGFVLLISLFIYQRPERWESTPEGAASIPGVWGHMMSFLGGPRACIGYRFALVEYVHPSPSQNKFQC